MRSGLLKLVIAALVLLPSTWARGEEEDATKRALADAMEAALDTGRNGDAYELAADLVARDPRDPRSRLLAAQAAYATLRRREALDHLAAGLEVQRRDVDLLTLRAGILLEAGDLANARTAATLAFGEDHEAEEALAIIEQIELVDRARARLSGADAGLEAGSPAAFVDGVFAEIAGGASPREIARHFDLSILDGLDSRRRSREELVSFLEGVARSSRPTAGTVFVGWTILDADDSSVHVLVPASTLFMPGRKDTILTAYADPRLRDTLDAYTLALLDGVDEDERAALLDRMVGTESLALAELTVEVAAHGDSFRIHDVLRDGVSTKALLASFAPIIEENAKRAPLDVPYLIGKLVGALLVIAFVAWLIFKSPLSRL